MGADGRLMDPDVPPHVIVTCGRCSRRVVAAPASEHPDCLDTDGGLPVQVEVGVPFEER